MQQIKSLKQNKKATKLVSLLICNNLLVRQVDCRWNQVYESMLLLYEKLVGVGLAPETQSGN